MRKEREMKKTLLMITCAMAFDLHSATAEEGSPTVRQILDATVLAYKDLIDPNEVLNELELYNSLNYDNFPELYEILEEKIDDADYVRYVTSVFRDDAYNLVAESDARTLEMIVFCRAKREFLHLILGIGDLRCEKRNASAG